MFSCSGGGAGDGALEGSEIEIYCWRWRVGFIPRGALAPQFGSMGRAEALRGLKSAVRLKYGIISKEVIR